MADAAATAGAAGSGTRSGSKQSTNPADNYHLARRRTLQVVVSSLLTEAGFESAEKASVETLTEMLQSYISEIGRSAKSYCEHTARTQPTLSDIVVTLVEMGFNVDTLPAYAKRSQRMVITAPPVTNQPVTPKALTAGQNRPHPPHIPSHFPEFPDPHTYIKTPTYREPVSDYQVLREKAASQRRDVERALTRFMAKTGETQSLFKDDVSTFPLIAARPFTIPYLTALLPSELEMQQMEETDSSEQDEQTDTENLPLHISPDDSGAEKENTSVLQQNPSLSGSRNGEESIIDNPYLRPVKKPKIRRKNLVSCMYLFLVAWTLSILQPRDQPAQPSSLFPSLEGELAEPPPAGLQGFLFFLGPSPEPRRKPALYRNVDATLLGELKPLEGRGRWSSRGRAEAVGCESGMILIANSVLRLPIFTGF
ncbi:transcription initiation factor TFIID subunit 8 isoform X1 [Odocoileus virginianus]|uniref:Transcription initiation factor TFIID subunit 8 n=2 Tax=Odocoileus virginianus TaxID=9874 RepID=A0A6J0WPY0_ODOVR